MLSEGVRGVDNVYSLKDGMHSSRCSSLRENIMWPDIMTGVLTLALDKESYERAGLVGKPDGARGKRGTRPRWSEPCLPSQRRCVLIVVVVEINLRLPSMLHGKKGFDRIVYAFKNVLTKPVTWIFTNLCSEGMYIFYISD
jgi:ribonucleases P/MRP protein subunit RPP40